MIRFSERIMEPEAIVPLWKKYGEILPMTPISDVEARSFWDDMFSKPIETRTITEEDLQRDVYGRSEEEFSFDFDASDPGIRLALGNFKDDSWNCLTETEKEEVSQTLLQVIAEKLGIKSVPKIEFYESHPNDCGAFNPNKNVVSVNKNNFDNPNEIIDTIAHEMRHAYQFQRASNPENYVDLLYAYNFENYIAPYADEDGYVNFMDYQDQLIEAEARAFANMFRMEDAIDE